jgi:hypothetical protein
MSSRNRATDKPSVASRYSGNDRNPNSRAREFRSATSCPTRTPSVGRGALRLARQTPDARGPSSIAESDGARHGCSGDPSISDGRRRSGVRAGRGGARSPALVRPGPPPSSGATAPRVAAGTAGRARASQTEVAVRGPVPPAGRGVGAATTRRPASPDRSLAATPPRGWPGRAARGVAPGRSRGGAPATVSPSAPPWCPQSRGGTYRPVGAGPRSLRLLMVRAHAAARGDCQVWPKAPDSGSGPVGVRRFKSLSPHPPETYRSRLRTAGRGRYRARQALRLGRHRPGSPCRVRRAEWKGAGLSARSTSVPGRRPLGAPRYG